MVDALVGFFQGLPGELVVSLISLFPIVELKGAIGVGLHVYQLPLWTTFGFAYLGSCLPVPFLLLFLRPIMRAMKRTRLLHRFAEWLERRSDKKGAKIRQYSYIGLFLFVAVPLPGTGVWMGSLIASLLDLRFKYALPVILLGNLIAGFLMLLFWSLGWLIF